MAWASNAEQVTILGRRFESFDEVCRDFNLSQSSARKQAVRELGKDCPFDEMNKRKKEILIKQAEEAIKFYNMRQDFALGKYTRRAQ